MAKTVVKPGTTSPNPGKAGRQTPTPPASSNRAAAQAAAASALKPGRRVKVRATRMGYYGEKRIREGDVFVYTIGERERGLPTWVEPVDKDTPERITTGTEALRREHDRILAERMPGSGQPLTDDDSNNPLGA